MIPTQPHEPEPSREIRVVCGKALRLFHVSEGSGASRQTELGYDLPGTVRLPASDAIARLPLVSDVDILLKLAAIASARIIPLAGRNHAAMSSAIVPANLFADRRRGSAVLCPGITLALAFVQHVDDLQGKNRIEDPIVVAMATPIGITVPPCRPRPIAVMAVVSMMMLRRRRPMMSAVPCDIGFPVPALRFVVLLVVLFVALLVMRGILTAVAVLILIMEGPAGRQQASCTPRCR